MWLFVAQVTKPGKFPASNPCTSLRTHQFLFPPLNVVRPVSPESDESKEPNTSAQSQYLPCWGRESSRGLKLLSRNTRFPVELSIRRKSLNQTRTCTVIKIQEKFKS